MARREVVPRLVQDRPARRHDDEVANTVGDREQLHRTGEDVCLPDPSCRVDDGLEGRLLVVDIEVL